LFLEFFALCVGPRGHLYCQDLAKKFFPFLQARIEDISKTTGVDISQRVTVMTVGHTDFGNLENIDIIFLSDTYHHIEYPSQWLSCAYDTLAPGGHLIIIDFEKNYWKID